MTEQPLLRAEQALLNLAATKFEDREIFKSHFFTLYKTCEDFQRMASALCTEDRAVLLKYMALVLRIAKFTQEPLFVNTFAQFDHKLRKNVIKRCAIEPLEVLIRRISVIAADVDLSRSLLEIACELCNPKYCTEALAERLARIAGSIIDQIPSESLQVHFDVLHKHIQKISQNSNKLELYKL